MSGRSSSRKITLLIMLMIIGLVAAGQAAADLPMPPAIPDLSPTPTPAPADSGSHGSASGGSGSPPATIYVPEIPSPTPTPVPPYDLAIVIPDSITVDSVKLSVQDGILYAPGGTALSDIVKNDTFDVILPSGDNSTSKLTITIDRINATAASFRSARLTSEKTLELNGSKVDVLLKASIGGWPTGGRLDAVLVEPAPIDISKINEQFGAYVNTNYEQEPLVVVDVRRSGLENGKDIFDCYIILTIERQGSVDQNATYGALRQNDGMYELLNATLLSGSADGPMVFEISSPRGFSEFTLVREKDVTSALPVSDASPGTSSGSGAGMIILLITNLAALTVIGYVLVRKGPW